MHLSSKKHKKELPNISDSFLKDDEAFHRRMADALKQGYYEGDVIPFVIERNVPLRILQNLWPEAYESLETAPLSIAFAAAETGWKGRISNLCSQIQKNESGHWEIQAQKSHVIDADLLLLLVRHTPTQLALCLFPQDREGLLFQRRNEAGLILPKKDGSPVGHSRLEAQIRLDARNIQENVVFIEETAYSKIAAGIPALEVSSMAILSLAILERHEIQIPKEMRALPPLIFQARRQEKSLRRALVLSRKLLRFFYHSISKAHLQVHPFWLELQKLSKIA